MTSGKPKLFRFSDISDYEPPEKSEAFYMPTDGPPNAFGMNYTVFKNCDDDWSLTYDEALICLQGTVSVETDGERYTLKQGDTMWLPKGRRVRYIADDVSIAIAIFYPGQPEADPTNPDLTVHVMTPSGADGQGHD